MNTRANQTHDGTATNLVFVVTKFLVDKSAAAAAWFMVTPRTNHVIGKFANALHELWSDVRASYVRGSHAPDGRCTSLCVDLKRILYDSGRQI